MSKNWFQISAILFLIAVCSPVFIFGKAEKELPGSAGALRGQEVYFNAWGGSESINQYLREAAVELKKKYGIILKHVKVVDTTDVVRRILAEKKAGKTTGGSVDLVWINGENFKFLKENDLLSKIGLDALPSAKYLDFKNKNLREDFTIPTDDLEAPWGTAQLVMIGDPKKNGPLPQNLDELLDWAKKNPGKFAYPKPPNFHGTTFVKQILLELNPNSRALFSKPLKEETSRESLQKVWKYLDQLHPYMWRKGRRFPQSIAQMHTLLNRGTLGLSFSFNPYEADNLVREKNLPPGVRTYNFNRGTVGNTHFIAIPFNSSVKDAARVVINFLLSPAAQAKKSDPKVWGDPTVLDLNILPPAARAKFDAIEYGKAAPKTLYPVLPEPHPTWTTRLEEEWNKRYGAL